MKRHADSIALYHSSTVEVAEPQWGFAAGTGSERNDFGLGFYASLDQEQPVMLLCGRPQVVLNQYRLDLTGLRTKALPNNTEWLLTVTSRSRDIYSAVTVEEMLAAYGLHILSPERAIAKLLERSAVSVEAAD
jgi:hypothetical protein